MSNAEPLPPIVAQDPSSFEVAVRDRSWDWLLELRRRLKIDLVLVDARPFVLVPTAADHTGRLAAMLEHGEAPVVSAISATLKARVPQALESGGLQIASMPVTSDRHTLGALLVARLVPPRQDPGASRAQLDLVASWLTTAVEAHLLSPPAFPSSGLNRVASLAQLLGQPSSRESDRELIRLFGEAIAVWHDIEVSGYVETTNGAFARDVTLPGTRTGERPTMIAAVGLPESSAVTQLPQGHLDRFGLPVHDDVYVRRFLGAEGGSWLLVFTGVIAAYDLQRISAYSAVLELALSLCTVTFTTKVATALSGSLACMDAGPEACATEALEKVRTALGAAVATLTIESKNGAAVLSATTPALSTKGVAESSAGRVVLVKRSERHYTTTVSLGRHERLEFTPRDHAVAGMTAAIFDSWGTAAFSATASRRERRATTGGFPEILQRAARESLERGSAVTVVVLLIREAASMPGSTQGWVAELRGRMRASDLAGMLDEGEIALLMHDTGAAQARSIAERLRTAAGESPARASILIGVACRNPGQGSPDDIVHDARADAVAGSRRARMSDSPHGVNR